jgi:hypothetical protein
VNGFAGGDTQQQLLGLNIHVHDGLERHETRDALPLMHQMFFCLRGRDGKPDLVFEAQSDSLNAFFHPGDRQPMSSRKFLGGHSREVKIIEAERERLVGVKHDCGIHTPKV